MNILVTILALLLALYLVSILVVKLMRAKWSKADREFFNQNWERIVGLTDQKYAVMEADKLLDIVLKRRGYRGTLGEKLKRHDNLFSDINGLWFAHKLRNKLAHELDYRLTESQSRQALKAFRKAFSDLGLF